MTNRCHAGAVALHDELAALRAAVGDQAFEDPATFRAAFDDFVPEGSASTGELSLLVGAIATGALQRLREQLALGADAETAIAVQGELLARDRGTTESGGARWALSVLAHAVGAVPADQVITRPSVAETQDVPDRPAPAATEPAGAEVAVTEPVGPGPTERASGAAAPRDAHRTTSRLLVAAVVVLAVVAVTALALLFLRDDDAPSADTATDSPGATDESPADEEVLSQVDMTEAGKTIRVQLVRNGTDAEIVLMTDQGGEYVEVDRQPAACPYLDASFDAGVEDEGDGAIYIGWQNRDNEDFGQYGQVEVEEEMLVIHDIGGPCPTSR